MITIKEIEKKLPELHKRRDVLKQQLSEEQKKSSKLRDRLEDKTSKLFDRALKSLKGGESIMARNRVIYNEISVSMEFQKDLQEDLNELSENIEILEAESRKAENERIAEEAKALLIKLQESQVTQFELLKELAAKRDEIEKNIRMRMVPERVDSVKVEVLDEVMKKRYQLSPPVNEKVTIEKLPDFNIRYQVEKEEKVTNENSVIHIFPYKVAERLARQGKVKIIEDGHPKYENVPVRDPEPSVLKDFAEINLGYPVSINDELLPFFKEAKKKIGMWFSLELSSVDQL
jgi:hypothetical protein